MARFEREGYCPFNTVASILGEDDIVGYNLRGLWSLVGPSVVCEEDIRIGDPNVVFTTDPVAECLLQELCKMWTGTEKILVSAPHEHACACNIQSVVDINEYCTREGNKLIVSAGSRYTVIVGREDETIHVYVWDLNCTF